MGERLSVFIEPLSYSDSLGNKMSNNIHLDYFSVAILVLPALHIKLTFTILGSRYSEGFLSCIEDGG